MDSVTNQLHNIPTRYYKPTFGEFPVREILESGMDSVTNQLHNIPTRYYKPTFGEFPVREILESGMDSVTNQLHNIPTQWNREQPVARKCAIRSSMAATVVPKYAARQSMQRKRFAPRFTIFLYNPISSGVRWRPHSIQA